MSEPLSRPPTGELELDHQPPRREPGRITIGTDPSGVPRRPSSGGRRRGGAAQTRSGRPAGPARTSAGQTPPPRNLPAAIAAGLILAALFVIATLWRPVVVLVLITIVLAIAAFEYFGKVTEKGYRPAVAPGLAACVAAPLATYWVGETALPLIVAFAFIAGAVGFIGAHGVESGPLPNMAITTMGVVWIGVLGSFATLILRWSNLNGGNDIGTDTLFVIVLGVVANDIGALLVGSSLGKTPLRGWISPGKTLEGLIGGTLLTLLVLFVVGLTDRSTTWSTGDLLILAIVIAVFAPLGDLTESMFKRNLDVKDFGALVSGHGGVLDRFDAFLFVLPVAYYVTLGPRALDELTPVRVAIAGSSGSIGTQALDVVRAEAPRYEVVALGVGSALDVLVEQAAEFRPRVVAIGDPARRAELAAAVPFATVVDDLAGLVAEAEVVVNAVVGFAGLPVTLATLRAGRRLALANKESLIAAGPVVQPLRATPGAELIPVDSEHCALHQCLRSSAAPEREVARLLLTASGGPFRGRIAADLAGVGVDQALAHPTWRMGPKITVDSSTLMNKGLEVIEAHELFGMPYDADRGHRPPPVRHPLDGRVHRRLDDRPAQPARHAPADRLRPRVAGAHRHAVRAHRLGDARVARVRAARPGDVPLPRPRLPGRTGRRTPRRGSARPTRSPSRRSWPGRSAGCRSQRCAMRRWTGMI